MVIDGKCMLLQIGTHRIGQLLILQLADDPCRDVFRRFQFPGCQLIRVARRNQAVQFIFIR